MIIDIHTHTYPKSDDSFLSPGQLIQQAKKMGLDGICITDHDGFWNPEEVLRLGAEHDYLVLPGCEVTTEEGHLLVFGLEKYIFGMHKASFVKGLVDEAGGAIVVAHPYRRNYREEENYDEESYKYTVNRACASMVFSLCDAVEVFNGRGSHKENAFSREVSKRFNLPGTGASDAHKLEEVGTYATSFERRIRSLSDLIQELKSGRFRPVALQPRRAKAKTAR